MSAPSDRGGRSPATRKDLVSIFRAAIEAVAPERLVAQHLARNGDVTAVRHGGAEVNRFSGLPLVVGIGKAAGRMAAAVGRIYAGCGGGKLRGLVIVPDGGTADCGLLVREAGHPLPDERGRAAAAELAELIRTAPEATVIVLLSGGASSLLTAPHPPLGLADKIAVTRLLLGAGADIGELNTVRKHLSFLKGGGLLRLAGSRKVVTLALSDVVGDDPAVIGSGPTVADPTTFADAARVFRRHNLEPHLPVAARKLLDDGVAGRVSETLKPAESKKYDAVHIVIGSNRLALAGAAARAAGLGYRVDIEERPLTGDTTACAREWAARVITAGAGLRCLLAGGETTVTVQGAGRGGRNQEFALAAARLFDGHDVAALSAGTDGIDGPTDAAGAFVDGSTLARARAAGLDADAALAANDSYSFFDRLGDLFRCGPTGTNVVDIKIALRGVAHPGASS